MPLDMFIALVGFAFVTSATPGPNTMMLLASGVNFGVRPTLPHMAGITIGLGAMLLAVGTSVGTLITSWPQLHRALQVASVIYMLWLAWRIATAGRMRDETNAGRPMSFLEAAGFQWVNPKAWAIALSGTASYTVPGAATLSLLILVAVFVAMSMPVTLAWTAFGVGVRRLLQDEGKVRIFNIAMALLLVASLAPVVASWWT